MDTNITTMGRGKTEPTDTNVHLEGQKCAFLDTDPANPKVPRSAKTVHAVRVKNSSGGALLPGYSVKWAAGYHGTRTDNVTATGDKSAGFVDDHVPAAGVPDGYYYWLIVNGPCNMVTDGSSTLSQEDPLVTVTGGKVKKQVAAPADATAGLVQANSRVGLCTLSVAATDALSFLGDVQLPFNN